MTEIPYECFGCLFVEHRWSSAFTASATMQLSFYSFKKLKMLVVLVTSKYQNHTNKMLIKNENLILFKTVCLLLSHRTSVLIQRNFDEAGVKCIVNCRACSWLIVKTNPRVELLMKTDRTHSPFISQFINGFCYPIQGSIIDALCIVGVPETSLGQNVWQIQKLLPGEMYDRSSRLDL